MSFDGLHVRCLVTEAYGGHGGIAQSCRDTIAALAGIDQVADIDVVPRHVQASIPELPRKTRQRSPSPGRATYALRAMALQGPRPDLVFCNHLYMAPLAAVTARMARARLIVQLHGIEIWTEPTRAQREALEAADQIWCVSRDTRARACTYADLEPERVVVINNTCDDRFEPANRQQARRQFGLESEVALLTVGRLDSRERYKGHERVFDCLRRLVADSVDASYLIAGDGDDRARLQQLASSTGLSDRVRFLGHVRHEDLPALYSAADIFVLPSTGEGFGIAFLEAMTCGTPALGLAVGGAADALADGKLGRCVAEPHLYDALTACITAPQDRDSIRRAAIERFGQRAFRSRVRQALAMLDNRIALQ